MLIFRLYVDYCVIASNARQFLGFLAYSRVKFELLSFRYKQLAGNVSIPTFGIYSRRETENSPKISATWRLKDLITCFVI